MGRERKSREWEEDKKGKWGECDHGTLYTSVIDTVSQFLL